MQREIRLFRSWNNLPRAQNLKPKFEFQTSLARNSPAGTSELIPFAANLDLPWNFPAGTSELLTFGVNSDLPWGWRFLEILLGGSSLLFPVGFYHASPFVGDYIFTHWGFIIILLYWVTKSITKSTIFHTFPSTHLRTTYI